MPEPSIAAVTVIKNSGCTQRFVAGAGAPALCPAGRAGCGILPFPSLHQVCQGPCSMDSYPVKCFPGHFAAEVMALLLRNLNCWSIKVTCSFQTGVYLWDLKSDLASDILLHFFLQHLPSRWDQTGEAGRASWRGYWCAGILMARVILYLWAHERPVFSIAQHLPMYPWRQWLYEHFIYSYFKIQIYRDLKK